MRHAIELISRSAPEVRTVVYTTHLSFWVESFINAPSPTHSSEDWQLLTINRCEGEVAGPLELESDAPPMPLSHYPNRISPIQPWTPTA